MGALHQLLNAIIVVCLIYVIAVLLKKRAVLTEENSLTLARLVTDVCLPAIVFTGLAGQRVTVRELEPSALMLGLEISCVLLAWGVSRLLRFDLQKQGAVVLCSAFGSSTFLGYSIITQMYPGNQAALGEAVLISEIGVGYPIFILGPMLAAYFSGKKSGLAASLGFFRSPVFFALIAGILWGALNLPGKDSFLAPLFNLGSVLSGALTPLAIISVGLMFRRPTVKTIALPLAVVVMVKLILKPVAASAVGNVMGLPDMWHDIVVVLAAMPPAVLGVVYLRRYGGDASLASALLLTATILSAATLIGVFWLVGA